MNITSVMSFPSSSRNRNSNTRHHNDSIANENDDVVGGLVESELGVEFSETLV